MQFPERFTYLEDPKSEHLDPFFKTTATVAANMRENLNMRLKVFLILCKVFS